MLIGPEQAPLARVLASRAGLRALDGPEGTGLAADARDAQLLLELLAHLEDASVDPRVVAWLEHASTWRGNIEVKGPSEAPLFVLLGDVAVCRGGCANRPRAFRAERPSRSRSIHGG